MDPLIRKARMDDADALFALVEQFARSFRPQRAAFRQVLERLLRDEAVWLSVAEGSGGMVGYCLGFDHDAFYANGRVSYVEEIFVAPDHRRNGIGRALMMAFEEWARSRGSKLVGLATRRAAPFYSALGFEESAVFFRKVL